MVMVEHRMRHWDTVSAIEVYLHFACGLVGCWLRYIFLVAIQRRALFVHTRRLASQQEVEERFGIFLRLGML